MTCCWRTHRMPLSFLWASLPSFPAVPLYGTLLHLVRTDFPAAVCHSNFFWCCAPNPFLLLAGAPPRGRCRATWAGPRFGAAPFVQLSRLPPLLLQKFLSLCSQYERVLFDLLLLRPGVGLLPLWCHQGCTVGVLSLLLLRAGWRLPPLLRHQCLPCWAS